MVAEVVAGDRSDAAVRQLRSTVSQRQETNTPATR
jgi:hypothetical protein